MNSLIYVISLTWYCCHFLSSVLDSQSMLVMSIFQCIDTCEYIPLQPMHAYHVYMVCTHIAYVRTCIGDISIFLAQMMISPLTKWKQPIDFLKIDEQQTVKIQVSYGISTSLSTYLSLSTYSIYMRNKNTPASTPINGVDTSP